MIVAHEDYARQAAAQGAQVICFQELFYGPYFCQVQDKQYYEYAESIPGPTTEIFSGLAKELGVSCVLNLLEKDGGRTSRSRLLWDGDTLVFEDTISLPDGRQVTDVVRYTLKDGGKTFVAEEKFRGPVVKYDNLWVADKKD
jgi:predicted amidohydrolase